MPLSDMPIERYALIRYAWRRYAQRGYAQRASAGVTRERSTRSGGTHHCLGEIVGAGSDLRELFGDVRLDVRIRRAGAPRRGQGQLARNAPCMFDGRLGIRIILPSCRIVNSKHLE